MSFLGFLQKPQEQDNRLPPPRTLILDFTMTHTSYGSSIQRTTGQLTHTRRSDGTPDLDGDLQKVTGDKIRYYCQIYLDKSDPIVFMPITVDTGFQTVFMTILTVYFSYTFIGKHLF